MSASLKLYAELACWWPLFSHPRDYAPAAAVYRRILERDPTLRDVLELGSGGGNNASHLKARYRMTLVDRSPDMLAVSRELNPECEHSVGDMRKVRLGRIFDAVFIHDAITYMTSPEDLRLVFETAFVHLRPGGLGLFVPDHVSETFRPSTDHGGHDGADRSIRYLQWTWDPDPSDGTYVTDFAYMYRTGLQPPTVESERHLGGLFSEATWLDLLRRTGFESEMVRLDEEWARTEGSRVFLGRKPA